jgi:hypothetical protein
VTARTAARGRLLMLLLAGAVSSRAYGFQAPDAAALTALRDDAITQVKRIVNEPVPALPRAADAPLGVFTPGWFHPGAAKPNFSTVDVRLTQKFPYDKFEYVTSDVTPGLMFRGQDLEFNPMTKYFYTDYSLPKKRLSPDEMTEINRLYRVIGKLEQEIARVRAGLPLEPVAPAADSAPVRKATPFYVAAGVTVLMLAIVLYRVRAARS